MNYTKNDLDKLYIEFYEFVDKIIYNIHVSPTFDNKLFICTYKNLNTNENYEYPLTFCLGGGGYMLYKKIFEIENINYSIDLTTYDYDISFCLNQFLSKDELNTLAKKIKTICEDNLSEFNFMGLTNNIFTFEYNVNNDRLHCRINCNTEINKPFHILELSFWLNGKISDNYTKNDFNKNKLLLYERNDVYYYLLPLELLVKTTLYAIVDFFEKRNFNKCVKYLNRIKFIKKINDQYLTIETPSNILNVIFGSYNKKIKRKYKMIHDYPYTLANEFVKINNNGVVKCIYRELRKSNKNEILSKIDKYKKLCKDKKPYNYNDSENTLVDT